MKKFKKKNSYKITYERYDNPYDEMAIRYDTEVIINADNEELAKIEFLLHYSRPIKKIEKI